MEKKTQRSEILRHLKEKGTLTSTEAIELYGATRLAAHIYALRKSGHDIETRDCLGKNRYDETCRYAKYVYHGFYPGADFTKER